MGTVFITQGVSGAGKSTFTDTLDSPAVVSADHHYMVDGEYLFDLAKIGDAHRTCFREFIQLVTGQGDQDIVVDNTNMERWAMYPYVQAAQAFGWEVEIHTFLVDPEVAAERNTHGVPLDRIRFMLANMEMPLPFWGRHVVHATEGWGG